jgi:hypothetical protein
MTINFLFSVPYHVIGKLETAADDFQVEQYTRSTQLVFTLEDIKLL